MMLRLVLNLPTASLKGCEDEEHPDAFLLLIGFFLLTGRNSGQ
jgi:hypothetical protein